MHKLQLLLKQREQKPSGKKHICQQTGLHIGSDEKELIKEGLQGLESIIAERLKAYEEKETTFQGFQRLQKEYTYLQSQITLIDALMKKL